MKSVGKILFYIFVGETILYVIACLAFWKSNYMIIATFVHWAFVSFWLFLITFNHKRCFVVLVANIFRWLIPVELIGWNGSIHYSLIDKSSMTGSIYWFNNIGQVILLSNGLISEDSEASYIKFWLPLRKVERVEHILKNDLPDFQEILSIEDEKDKMISILRAYQHLAETAI